MHASYELRLAQRFRTRLQLNVSNLLDNRDLVITSYGTYNVGGVGAGRLVQSRQQFLLPQPAQVHPQHDHLLLTKLERVDPNAPFVGRLSCRRRGAS